MSEGRELSLQEITNCRKQFQALYMEQRQRGKGHQSALRIAFRKVALWLLPLTPESRESVVAAIALSNLQLIANNKYPQS